MRKLLCCAIVSLLALSFAHAAIVDEPDPFSVQRAAAVQIVEAQRARLAPGACVEAVIVIEEVGPGEYGAVLRGVSPFSANQAIRPILPSAACDGTNECRSRCDTLCDDAGHGANSCEHAVEVGQRCTATCCTPMAWCVVICSPPS